MSWGRRQRLLGRILSAEEHQNLRQSAWSNNSTVSRSRGTFSLSICVYTLLHAKSKSAFGFRFLRSPGEVSSFGSALDSSGMDARLKEVVSCALALADDPYQISQRRGFESIARFATSVGRFGSNHSALLFPLYSNGEVPQVRGRALYSNAQSNGLGFAPLLFNY